MGDDQGPGPDSSQRRPGSRVARSPSPSRSEDTLLRLLFSLNLCLCLVFFIFEALSPSKEQHTFSKRSFKYSKGKRPISWVLEIVPQNAY